MSSKIAQPSWCGACRTQYRNRGTPASRSADSRLGTVQMRSVAEPSSTPERSATVLPSPGDGPTQLDGADPTRAGAVDAVLPGHLAVSDQACGRLRMLPAAVRARPRPAAIEPTATRTIASRPVKGSAPPPPSSPPRWQPAGIGPTRPSAELGQVVPPVV